jgi:hypothetical protein
MAAKSTTAREERNDVHHKIAVKEQIKRHTSQTERRSEKKRKTKKKIMPGKSRVNDSL